MTALLHRDVLAPAGRATSRLTPNVFGIAFGLGGLAQAWDAAARLVAAPAVVADVLWVVVALSWAAVLVAYVRHVITHRRRGAELADPTFGPFLALAAIVAMMLGGALGEHDHTAGTAVWVVALLATIGIGGALNARWILGEGPIDFFHPGYLIPTVAAGYVASLTASGLGLHTAAEALFGYASLSWMPLGAVLLVRLFTGPALPVGLRPTLAILSAPGAVGNSAWFAINGGRIDAVAAGLAGYTVLMVVVQLGLVGAYRDVLFGAGWWAFSFSYAAVCGSAIHWLAVEHVTRQTLWTYGVLAVLTAFLAMLVVRSVVALRRGTFLPRA